jgi:hypothetical protein
LLSTTRVLGSVVMRPASGAQLLESPPGTKKNPATFCLLVSKKHDLVDLYKAVL